MRELCGAEIVETFLTKHGLFIWTPPFQTENSNVSMLEYYYKEKRTMVDFRRGPLGSHFDGFAAYLKAKGYTTDWGKAVLGKCCQFNSFLIDQGITRCAQLTESHIDPFLEVYFAHTRSGARYNPASSIPYR